MTSVRFLRATVAGIVLGAAAGVCTFDAPGAGHDALPAAHAVSSVPAAGSYKVKLKGDGWTASRSDAPPAAHHARVAGNATIVVRPRDLQVNDGLFTVEIALDGTAQQTPLGAATPGKPAFRGTAALLGDAISVMDDGTRTGATVGLWVNAVHLKFDAAGRKVSGSWMAIFPGAESDLATQGFAAGVTASFAGRRTFKAESPRVR